MVTAGFTPCHLTAQCTGVSLPDHPLHDGNAWGEPESAEAYLHFRWGPSAPRERSLVITYIRPVNSTTQRGHPFTSKLQPLLRLQLWKSRKPGGLSAHLSSLTLVRGAWRPPRSVRYPGTSEDGAAPAASPNRFPGFLTWEAWLPRVHWVLRFSSLNSTQSSSLVCISRDSFF